MLGRSHAGPDSAPILDAPGRAAALAAACVAPDLVPKVPQLHQVVGLRNILVQIYDGADPQVVWIAASAHVPALVTAIRELIKDDPVA